MIQITDVILISLFIEAIVGALKPIWSGSGEKLTVTEYVSMAAGILLAVTCRINMLAYVVDISYPAWVEYIFYVLTGIAIGRGTNFIYDLWKKLREWQNGNLIGDVVEYRESVDSDELTDNQLRAILIQLGATTEQISSNKTREELEALLDSFAVEAGDPPAAGGVK